MRKPQFIEDHIYHIYNRGVEKRNIFSDDEDYFRFIHNLYEFNDESPVVNVKYYFNPEKMNVKPPYSNRERKPRKLLVEILLFTLMPNHFHLLLRQREKNGIVKFMQKLGTGYTMYFNQKHKRVGGLFQGRFKAINIEREVHVIHLPHYIHTNPLSLNYGGSTSIEFLENYRWSSFPDYIGKKNFPSVTKRGFLLKVFGSEKKYKALTEELLKEYDEERNLEKIKDIILE
jgi:putative transposase